MRERFLRNRPVRESAFRIRSSAEPSAMTRPPCLPAPGPRSISARRAGWCPRRARPPPACCLSPEDAPACRAGSCCRADAGRSWVVQDVAHAAQVGSELRGEADALRASPPGERRRRAVERKIGEAHLIEERETRTQLRDDVCARSRPRGLRAPGFETAPRACPRGARRARRSSAPDSAPRALALRRFALAGGQLSSTSSHSIQESSTWSSVPVFCAPRPIPP